MSGIAGRTNYSDWNKKTSSLLSSLEQEENDEIQASKAALGHDKYASSEAEALEKSKAAKVSEMKKKFDAYKQREADTVQILSPDFDDDNTNNDKQQNKNKMIKFITRAELTAGKRVLNITDTDGHGSGNVILTEDLTNLQSQIPPNTNTKLTPKSYPGDAENAAAPYDPIKNGGTIQGLIKISLTNLKNCTVTVKCKIITGLLEISHCENVTIHIAKSATVVTVQADLCKSLKIEFYDAPSGKGITQSGITTMFWGEDANDRVFHAGVEDLTVKTFRDGFVDLEAKADYKQDGAKAVGNATAEEVQFVTSVVDGEMVTERILRNGSQTGTEREMKEIEEKKAKIEKAVEKRLGGIKIVDKEGNEVPMKKIHTAGNNAECVSVIEEVYAGMSKPDIDAIVKDCEAQKSKGNEAFVAGEYAQAVLLYTLVLDRAAELPDASDKSAPGKQLFPRHVVLSNRSACFLKLGHHEKALKDATEAQNIEPGYVKGVFRRGLALHAMGRYQEAITPLAAALKIEPKNKQIKQALQFAEVRMHQEIRKRMDR